MKLRATLTVSRGHSDGRNWENCSDGRMWQSVASPIAVTAFCRTQVVVTACGDISLLFFNAQGKLLEQSPCGPPASTTTERRISRLRRADRCRSVSFWIRHRRTLGTGATRTRLGRIRLTTSQQLIERSEIDGLHQQCIEACLGSPFPIVDLTIS